MGGTLIPLGLTVLPAPASWQQYVPGLIHATLRAWFAKQFGDAILTFPLVMAWGERGHPGAGKRSIGWLWPLLLLLGVATSGREIGRPEGMYTFPADNSLGSNVQK